MGEKAPQNPMTPGEIAILSQMLEYRDECLDAIALCQAEMLRQVRQIMGKPRHEFIDAGAELTRLYPIYISSTSNHAASRPDETLNVREAEHEYPRTYDHPTQSALIRAEINKIVTRFVMGLTKAVSTLTQEVQELKQQLMKDRLF